MRRTLLMLVVMLLSFAASAHGDTTTIRTAKGDIIELYIPTPDTLPVINQHTLKQEIRINQKPSIPITLNGQDIHFYTTSNFLVNAASEKITAAVSKIFHTIKDSLALGSYSYNLPDIVIGPDGKVAYYTPDAFSAYPATGNGDVKNGTLSIVQKQVFEKQFDAVLGDIELIPLVIDGEKAPFRLDMSFDFRVNS